MTVKVEISVSMVRQNSIADTAPLINVCLFIFVICLLACCSRAMVEEI